MTPQAQLAAFTTALEQVRHGTLGAAVFSNLARGHDALVAALPARFNEVLLTVLDRLESSALFSDESCSFSQRDLLDSLQTWADKAALQLPPS
ncbi:MAG: hypothetical protein JWQ72_1686 [Polaromonas sp.]|nr:hypothetical protein [Polaromonas sp.]